jgi:UDP-N-acetylglucosamine--N-acetylmuramyl-(pentapeptide) pyrophosphoryl-undecaprenol N-acetylglucosamine transferase
MKLLIADGGTGGHIFPALAVADEFTRRPGAQGVLFTGSPTGMESDIVPRHHYPLKLIEVGGLIGKSWLTKTKTLMQLPSAYLQSRRIIREFGPSVVIGFGAYASGPVLVAAHHRKVPILLVEPNAIPGFTNRHALKYAAAVAAGFEDVDGVFQGKAVVTGTPVRELKTVPVKKDKFTVGVFCGSQGAQAINKTIVQALPELAKLHDRLHWIHQTGKRDFEEIRKQYEAIAPFYEVTAFVYDVETFYSRCDLLICRAGAVTCAELTALGKASVLVPLPTATHNHQEQNARRLAEKGAAELILQNELTPETLLRTVHQFLDSPERLAEMSKASKAMGKPDATKKVVDLALKLVETTHLGG